MVMLHRTAQHQRVPPPPPRRGTENEAFDALLLAMLARKPILVLIGDEGAERRAFLQGLIRQIEGDGAMTLMAKADPALSVEQLIAAAAGSPGTDIDEVAARLEAGLDAAGAGLLAVDGADRLAVATVRDLFELSRSPSPGGRCLQILLSAGPAFRRTLSRPDVAEMIRAWGVVTELPPPGDSPPGEALPSAAAPSRRRGVAWTSAARGLALGTAILLVLATLTAGVSTLGVVGRPEIAARVRDAVEAARGAIAPAKGTKQAEAASPAPASTPPAPSPSAPPQPVAMEPPAPIPVAPPPPVTPLVTQTPQPPVPVNPPMRLIPPSAPAPAPAEVSPHARLSTLAQRGQRQIATRRLTSPPGDNAFETLQTMRGIDPNADEVASLLASIKDTYRMLGERAELAGSWDEARSFYERALRVDPDDVEFQARMNAASQ